jgi:hypothetical protein
MSVFKTTLQLDSVMVKKLDQPLVEFYKFTRGLKKNRKAQLQNDAFDEYFNRICDIYR